MSLYQRKDPEGNLISPFWYCEWEAHGQTFRKSTGVPIGRAPERSRAQARQVEGMLKQCVAAHARVGSVRLKTPRGEPHRKHFSMDPWVGARGCHWKRWTPEHPFRGRIAGVYAIYLESRLTYIGSTRDFKERWRAHGIRRCADGYWHTPWGAARAIDVKIRPAKAYADWLMIEQRLIDRLQPQGNKRRLRRSQDVYPRGGAA